MKKRKTLLPYTFYARHTELVARALLGKILEVHAGGAVTSGRIVETEAYRENDAASHSARGSTPRSAIMFGEPGYAYIYFIYGMYEMLNFVTEPVGIAGAVLIRALEPLTGESAMQVRRKGRKRCDWTNGPGRLCRAMGIEMRHKGEGLRGPVFWVYDDGWVPERIETSGRVGISVAQEVPWRFFVAGNPFVSRH